MPYIVCTYLIKEKIISVWGYENEYAYAHARINRVWPRFKMSQSNFILINLSAVKMRPTHTLTP